MIPLETELLQYLKAKDIPHRYNGLALNELDFEIGLPATPTFYLDAKEKRQAYSMRNWQVNLPQEHLFILDDLAARKVLYHAPYSAIVVRDGVRGYYFLFTVADLFSMPRQRANRPLEGGGIKGKWLIDLRSGKASKDLPGIFRHINEYLNDFHDIYSEGTACYGTYWGEKIGQQGTPRLAGYRVTDFTATR